MSPGRKGGDLYKTQPAVVPCIYQPVVVRYILSSSTHPTPPGETHIRCFDKQYIPPWVAGDFTRPTGSDPSPKPHIFIRTGAPKTRINNLTQPHYCA